MKFTPHVKEASFKDVIHLHCDASDSHLTRSYELFRAKKCQIGNTRKDLSESHITKAYKRCERFQRLTSGGPCGTSL